MALWFILQQSLKKDLIDEAYYFLIHANDHR